MASRSTLLIALLFLFTFPLWLGIGAGFFGLIVGLSTAVFGIVAAIFGVMVSIIVFPFKMIFGWGHWGVFPHFHGHGWVIVGVIILLLAARMQNKK